MKNTFYIFLFLLLIFYCNKTSKINSYLYEIELLDHNNQKIYWKDLPYQYKLVFFGYTHCPDICPTALHTMDKAKLLLTNSKIILIFITIDPERDTPQQIKLYLSNFKSPIIGITGNKEELNKIYKIFNVKFMIQKSNSIHKSENHKNHEVYGFNHTPFIYFLDPDNHILATYPTGIQYSTLVQEIRTFLK